MQHKDKIEHIQTLNEKKLRESLLIPLLSSMGFVDPIIHHHASEKGKDIICKEYDDKFQKYNYIGIVVKAGDVNGSASGSSSYFTLLNQIKQALNEPYKDIYELRELEIDQVIVIISGKFLATSLDSIFHTLRADKINKAIREPIDINKLVNLIDLHFGEYWNEIKDSKDSLKLQRDYLINNISKLSKLLFTDRVKEVAFLSKVTNSEVEVELFRNAEISRYIADIRYNKLSIEEIDKEFAFPSIHNDYVDIKERFNEIKNTVKGVLYDLDEPIELLKKIIVEKNPEKIVDIINELAKNFLTKDGHIHASLSDIIDVEEYRYELRKFKDSKKVLEKNGFVEIYDKLISKIQHEAELNLALFYNQYPKDNKDYWLKMDVQISMVNRTIEVLRFYTYKEAPIEAKDILGRNKLEIEKSKVTDWRFEIEFMPNYYGYYKEETMTPEQKAKLFAVRLSNKFQEEFIEQLDLNA